MTITFDHRVDAGPDGGLAFAVAEVPGIGGTIKVREDDFLVDERPLYEPAGEGEHAWLFVEKRGMSSSEMVSIIAKHFGVRESAVGIAGMKDKKAITRQCVSVHVPGQRVEEFPMLTHERVGILWADMHTNKLRLGHLRGNRFSIRVRDVDPLGVRNAHRILTTLARRGAPNYFGTQRFGARRNNHIVGKALIHADFAGAVDALLGVDPEYPAMNHASAEAYSRGDLARAIETLHASAGIERQAVKRLMSGADPKGAIASLPQHQRRFWISAFQSAVFNRVLADRLAAGTFDRILAGDLAWKHDNGAVFRVDKAMLDEPAERETLESRAGAMEISPSGPLWGPKMTRASGEVDRMEVGALERAGVSTTLLDVFANSTGIDVPGARRPLRVPVVDPEVEGGMDEHGSYIRCAFDLPAGSFATVVMREVMKVDETPASSSASARSSSPASSATPDASDGAGASEGV